MRLDMHSRRKILKANFEDYQRVSKKGRKELLDRLTPVTGLNRSYLAMALGTYDRNKEAANHRVFQAFSGIQTGLPFPPAEAHYDNGMEFINEPLLRWCLQRHIEATRSRSYHKNDNCYAERKNYDAVRKTVGYFRFNTAGECAALAEVYRWLCPLYNYWMPSFRLIAKEKQADGRYRKVYEKEAGTPYERLMQSPDISEECKAGLRRRRAGQNPAALNRKLNEAVGVLLKTNREKDKVKQPPCQEDGRAGAA